MDQFTSYTPAADSATTDGRQLAQRLTKARAGERALIADEFCRGALRVHNLTRKQSAEIGLDRVWRALGRLTQPELPLFIAPA